MRSRSYARTLAKEVSEGHFQFRGAEILEVPVKDKVRELYKFQLAERIIHGVVSDYINERLEPYYSPSLYSYRKGRTWISAIHRFAEYVRDFNGSNSSKKQPLFVIRKDIRKYTDMLPVDSASPLWDILRRKISDDQPFSRIGWEILSNVIRPEVLLPGGKVASRLKGVPTGSPISTSLYNVYFSEADHHFDQIEGAFYARYSDDIIFAHPDRDCVVEVEQAMESKIMQLRLAFHSGKDRRITLTRSGFSGLSCRGFQSSQSVPLLGCLVDHGGRVSLNTGKIQDFLTFVRRRVQLALSHEIHGGSRLAVVGDSIRNLLDNTSGASEKSVSLLQSAVTDRGQLKDIDYKLALIVAEELTGIRGPRAFRKLPIRQQREVGKIPSLVAVRNAAA